MTRAWTLVLALGAVLLWSASPGRADELPSFRIEISNHEFVPSSLSVPAGKKFRLLVKNSDSAKEEFESHELRREKIISPGTTAEIYIGPLDPGTYTFFGEFHPKTARGVLVAK